MNLVDKNKVAYYSVHSSLVDATHERVIPGSSKCLKRSQLILAGLNTSFQFAIILTQYFTKESTTVYIQKVDSTASTNDNQNIDISLPKSILSNLFTKTLPLLPGNSLTIHVYSRPQPQYLFPNSSKNILKHILNDRQLFSWWKKNLSLINGKRCFKIFNLPTRYLFVPNEEDEYFAKIGDGWTWGWPYGAQEKAWDVVPRFPDDSRNKALDMVTAEQSVENFSETLGCLGEFRSGVAGFFVVEFSRDAAKNCFDDGFELESLEKLLPKDDDKLSDIEFDELMKLLMEQDFADENSSGKSTETIIRFFIEHNVQELVLETADLVLKKLDNQKRNNEKVAVDANNISMLIKRKKK